MVFARFFERRGVLFPVYSGAKFRIPISNTEVTRNLRQRVHYQPCSTTRQIDGKPCDSLPRALSQTFPRSTTRPIHDFPFSHFGHR